MNRTTCDIFGVEAPCKTNWSSLKNSSVSFYTRVTITPCLGDIWDSDQNVINSDHDTGGSSYLETSRVGTEIARYISREGRPLIVVLRYWSGVRPSDLFNVFRSIWWNTSQCPQFSTRFHVKAFNPSLINQPVLLSWWLFRRSQSKPSLAFYLSEGLVFSTHQNISFRPKVRV